MCSKFKIASAFVGQEKYAPFYLKWVSQPFSFLNEPDSVVLENGNRFQKYLAKTHEDWQVKQASNALRLYSYYLTSLQKNSSIKSGSATNGTFLKHESLEKPSKDICHIAQKEDLYHLAHSGDLSMIKNHLN
ncbi:MAG: hypothetical protein U0586_16730 [Candidatus Brocadiaceae bacterium]